MGCLTATKFAAGRNQTNVLISPLSFCFHHFAIPPSSPSRLARLGDFALEEWSHRHSSFDFVIVFPGSALPAQKTPRRAFPPAWLEVLEQNVGITPCCRRSFSSDCGCDKDTSRRADFVGASAWS